MAHYLAVDIGAESGRVILGTLSGTKLELEGATQVPQYARPHPAGLVLGYIPALA